MRYIFSHVFSLIYTDACTERDKYNININNAKDCRHSDGNSDWEKSHRYICTERVTGRKARGLQMEEMACKCQTFLSLLSGRRKQTSNIFFLLYTNLKRGFS